MAEPHGLTGRLLYGVFFTLGVPALLLLWAEMAEAAVPLPALRHPALGIAIAAAGSALILVSWITLFVRGRGLPMNAFPPERLVTDGIYGWLADPIYVGFGATLLGVSIATGSSSGLWLVTPITWLAMSALVIGYERPDLRRRFKSAALRRPRLAFPTGGIDAPGRWERASVFLLVFGPWLLAYYGVQWLGVPRDAIHIELAFEKNLPVIGWTESVYALTYVFVPLTPLLLATRESLRRFALAGFVSTVVVTLLWVSIPVVVSYRPFEPAGWLGRMLQHERATSSGTAAFPAFHVLWAMIAADAWRDIARTRRRVWAAAGWTIAALIAVSCVTTGMHTALDIVAAALIFLPLRNPARTWERLRSWAERVANSWREWRLGPIRIMSHGLYAAAATALGTAIAGAAAGNHALPYIVLTGVSALLAAGLGAQALEGSPRLLRPFGYYGGIAGFLAGALVVRALGADPLLVLGAWATAGPWVQAIGRMRCLVQGCCHGGPASPHIGIRYVHSRSRVTQLAGLAGVPLHPTPLYSILANLASGLLLVRLWTLGASPTLVAGLYMMLNAIARFAEESFRAEPQTPVLHGLHVYHWFAIVAFVIGAVLTGVPSVAPAEPFAPIGFPLLAAALAMGLLAGLAMGVDFPRSNRRFSRLAAAAGPVGRLDLAGTADATVRSTDHRMHTAPRRRRQAERQPPG
jgi:protein-S-isoprenylcysteine O-methyltransferase Ste14